MAMQRPVLHGATIVDAFRASVRERGPHPAMRRRGPVGWDVVTWSEYGTTVDEVVAGLAELGLGHGEAVGVLSTNRVEWHVADLATLCNGSVTVPVYWTSYAPQVEYVLGHSESRLCFVEDAEQLAKVLEVRDALPKLDHVVVFDGDDTTDAPFVLTFEQLRELGRARLLRTPLVAEERAAAVQADDVATIVYTSGTTGPPKGTMLTHANLVWTLRSATTPFEVREGERLLSFLPLSHIAERMMSDFLPIAFGGETWFARSLATVAEDLVDCRPTVFFAVPRVWEKFHDGVMTKIAESPLPQRLLAERYLRLGARKVTAEQTGTAAPPFVLRAWRTLDRVVGAKIRHSLGLDAAHVLVTAAAPIHPDLVRWFHAVGLPIVELYGQTEDCGPTTANRPGQNRIGTVGLPIPGVTVRIADDGEILVRGGNVCLGYFKAPEATAELVDPDGWMHSGDLGSLDDDGYLRLTGRKKDLIITSQGKNVTPQEIETDLRYHPVISQAVVVGDGRRYLTALLTLDAEHLTGWAAERGKLVDLEALACDPDVLAEVHAAVEDVNTHRSHAESVRKYRVLAHDLTIAGGELTPTLKVKRNVVSEKYAALIDDMYEEV